MKILQLCKKFPFPVKDGETIAVSYLSKALYELGCDISLLAMNTKKHHYDISSLPKELDHYTEVHATDLDNELKAFDAFKNLFSKESYHISRFCCDKFEEQLVKMLTANDYDVIQLETLYLAPYISTIRKYSNASIAMRSHNVEHEIWQRISANTQSIPKRKYLQYLTKKLKRFEQEQLNEYDILLPITKRDLAIFKKMGFNKAAKVVPIGLDGRDYMANDKSFKEHLSLSFIGSLDWMPNLEGLQWFLKEVWPQLHKQYPTLEFHIAGRNTPQWMFNMNLPKITVHGEIPCARSFINEHSVMIVPLLSGSGMRAKILEGMALGKVIISSSIGLEGIDAENRAEVLFADNADEFLKAVEYCYSSNGQLKNIGQRAQVFISREYDNLTIARQLMEAYKALKPIHV